jgi:hypothetical protein
MPSDVSAVEELDLPELDSPELELLWLYSTGIVLYWVHDTSPGCERRPTGSSP